MTVRLVGVVVGALWDRRWPAAVLLLAMLACSASTAIYATTPKILPVEVLSDAAGSVTEASLAVGCLVPAMLVAGARQSGMLRALFLSGVRPGRRLVATWALGVAAGLAAVLGSYLLVLAGYGVLALSRGESMQLGGLWAGVLAGALAALAGAGVGLGVGSAARTMTAAAAITLVGLAALIALEQLGGSEASGYLAAVFAVLPLGAALEFASFPDIGNTTQAVAAAVALLLYAALVPLVARDVVAGDLVGASERGDAAPPAQGRNAAGRRGSSPSRQSSESSSA